MVKYRFAYTLLAALALAAACTNSAESGLGGRGHKVRMTFNASVDTGIQNPSATTRAELATGGAVLWTDDEAISVFAENGSSSEFKCKSLSGDRRSAVFSGTAVECDTYRALSPASLSASFKPSDGTIHTEMPSHQSAVKGGFDPSASLAVAETSGSGMDFRNVGALVNFTLQNDDIRAIHLSVTPAAGSSSPAGTINVGFSSGIPVASVESGCNDVTLEGEFANGGTYYMVLLPGEYEDVTLSFSNADGATATYTNPVPLEIERNDNINLFDQLIPDSKWVLPSISAAAYIEVDADGVTGEVSEVELDAAEGWTVSVSYSGCVDYAEFDAANGGIVYTVSPNTGSTERNGTITITLSKDGCRDIESVIMVTQEAGTPEPPVAKSWTKVTSVSDLIPGDIYVIACPSNGMVATDLEGAYLGNVSASFSSDNVTITTLPNTALVFTLGGSDGAWTFADQSGRTLGCTGEKKLGWNSGTLTWKITFSGSALSVTSTKSTYGSIQYNASAPRFNVYTSSQKAVALYHMSGKKVTTVTTLPDATDIDYQGATIAGSYQCANAAPTEAGFKYGTDPAYLTLGKTVSTGGSLSGTFNVKLTGLNSATTYYYKAYIVENGITYSGSVRSFTTSTTGGGTVSSGEADYPWPELPAQTDKNRDGIDDNNSDYYYSHTLRADASNIRNFSSCYSKSKLHPVWVAAPMHKCYLGSSGRNDSYKADPNIKCSQSPKFDGYTRGHMVGSSDRTVSVATNRQAFYYSNIGAQTSSGFNTGGGAWNNLEDRVDGYLCADTLYQVIGCIFDTFTDKYGRTVNAKTGSNSVGTFQVPTAWYKVLLRTKNGNTGKKVSECTASELQCVAFILGHYSNQSHKPSTQDMYPVSKVEELTGLTFFVNVPNAPKTSFNASDWGF